MKSRSLCLLTLLLVSVCLSAQTHYSTTVIPMPPGAISLRAEAMNNSGDVIGGYYISPDPLAQPLPFLYHDGVTIPLSISLGGDPASITLSDINNSGEIIGSAALANGQYHGFRYSHGLIEDLGTLNGAQGASWVRAMNSRGDVIGTSVDANGNYVPVLWKKTEILNLSLMPGTPSNAHAIKINEKGQILYQDPMGFAA